LNESTGRSSAVSRDLAQNFVANGGGNAVQYPTADIDLPLFRKFDQAR
jgi:hypothetical protein